MTFFDYADIGILTAFGLLCVFAFIRAFIRALMGVRWSNAKRNLIEFGWCTLVIGILALVILICYACLGALGWLTIQALDFLGFGGGR